MSDCKRKFGAAIIRITLCISMIALTDIFCADTLSAQMFSFDGLYMPVGVNVGVSPYGAHAGGELSFIGYNTHDMSYGLYADILHSKRGNRFSAGPEVAFPWGLILDGGFLSVKDKGRNYHGATLRAVLPFYVMPYIRICALYKKEAFVEAGVLCKLPIPLGN
jgi:hypothetical protein